MRARSIVGLLPRMAEVWLRDPRRLRADLRFAQQILGSSVCVRDPRIMAQSSDPRFAQQNPVMVRIRTLRITYIHYNNNYCLIHDACHFRLPGGRCAMASSE